jgi:hypothetical protein
MRLSDIFGGPIGRDPAAVRPAGLTCSLLVPIFGLSVRSKGTAIFDIVYLATGEPSRFAREVGAEA